MIIFIFCNSFFVFTPRYDTLEKFDEMQVGTKMKNSVLNPKGL
jgi:hypothetical protein